MDIYSYLKNDHRHVSQLMDLLIDTHSTQRRQQLFIEIAQQLTIHADTEEVTFYKAIEKASRSKQVEEKMHHADKEHEEIRHYIARLSAMPITDEKWMELFGEFKHSVSHHVEEEEEEIFKKAKQYLTSEQAKKLAHEMDVLKERYKKKLAAA